MAAEGIKHRLVSEHVLLKAAEKDALLEQYKISHSELPKIRLEDPAIAHLNAKAGDIIKIIRQSPSAGESLYYRVVVTA